MAGATESLDRQAFGRRANWVFKRLRSTRRLSLGEIAETLEVSVQTLGNWKRGTCFPKPAHAIQFAALAGISMTWLLYGIGEPPSDWSSGDYPQVSVPPATSEHDAVRQRLTDAFIALLDAFDAWQKNRR